MSEVSEAIRVAACLQPHDWRDKANACEGKEEAYLLAWAHFQHDLTVRALEMEEGER
jgi:hypothetical protein